MSVESPNYDGGDIPLTPPAEGSSRKKRLTREERDAAKLSRATERKVNSANRKNAPKKSSAKEAKSVQGKTRGAVAASLPQNRREIPLSSFDLLNGEFMASARNKRAGSIIAMVFVAASAGLGALGFMDLQQANEVKSQVTALKDEKEVAMEDFGSLTGLAVSEVELFERNDILTRSAVRSVVTQPDVVGLFKDLKFVEDPLVQVTSVTVSSPSFVIVEGDETKEVLEPASVVITVVGSSLNDIISWADSLRNSNIMENFQFARKGDSVTVTASFVKGHVSDNDLATLASLSINSEAISNVTVGPQEIVAVAVEGEETESEQAESEESKVEVVE